MLHVTVSERTTHLMFTGEASEAMALYGRIFPSFRVERVEHYQEGEPGPEGTVKRADAALGDSGFSRRFGWCSDRFGVSWQLNLP
jgi:predicted 3-demethylubiquinone-9 3-methyltransferase (glyoxalase superfamily)